MTAAPSEAQPEGIPVGEAQNNNALRFEDLTIDDDLPLLDRVVRYCRSGIALQRLVHVKMLAETAETVGMSATLSTLVPLLNPLVGDSESIIRQHLASQLLPLAIVCMVRGIGPRKHQLTVEEILADPNKSVFIEAGYKVVTSAIITHLSTLIQDSDMDVRRTASESLSSLATQLQPKDAELVVVPIPIALSRELKPKKGMPDGFHEELRITACNLVAELSGAAEAHRVSKQCVIKVIMPCVLQLCRDASFRVRRSAAQALPRVLGGTSLKEAREAIIPAFEELSNDDMYRVRKSTGECLVDMSRSLMILGHSASSEEKMLLRAMRRTVLIPIAIQLLSDANKFVRHGMMQFLGPFIASFYPLEEGALNMVLSGGSSLVESALPPVAEGGIGSQFFPHASSMVSRLNSSGATTSSSPTPTPATLDAPEAIVDEMEKLQQALPEFIRCTRIASLSLSSVGDHRRANPPDPKDLEAVSEELLQHFCALANIATGDETTDAEMRVYCAYSYPAVVLLFGPDHWQGPLKECFLALVQPGADEKAAPPLPVKRCLASSLHTVAHVLGPALTISDVLPIFRQFFLMDTDDSVRLNVIRNFPSLLALFKDDKQVRSEYLGLWFDICKGEDLLGAHKRSATNPMLLNWRQRDYVSRSLPDLLGLVSPSLVHKYLWPVLQMLLSDSVNLVRQDAEWSIPLILRAFCTENVSADKRWSAEVCASVISWLKDTILGTNITGTSSNKSKANLNGHNNFAQRQLYCRICSAMGLALRFGELEPSEQWDYQYTAATQSNAKHGRAYVPYQTLSAGERKHLRRLLVYDMLPPAFEMKDDRVTNVRLTLMKVLQSMPKDIKTLASVSEVLQELEDEVETWESFNGGENKPPPPPPSRNTREHIVESEHRAAI